MSRIRHATETFVNHLIDGVKKLISSNTEQINVLLQRNHLPAKDNRGVVTKPSDYKSQFTFAGLKSEGVTGLPTWSHVFGVNAYSGIDGFTNVYEYAFCNGEMYIRNQYPLNEDTWGEWQQLATTTKTDILFPFNTGYSGHWASSNKIVKNSLGQCVIYVSVKKTDGSDFTPGIVTIGTLPQGFKSKLNCGVGAYTETTSVGAGAFIYNQDVVNVNVQSNCKVVAFTLFYEVI